MKGIYETRPSLPKYCSTWDVNVVFNHLRPQETGVSLSLKELSHRLAFLLSLLSGPGCQTINKLSIDHMVIEDSKVTFVVREKFKYSRPGNHQQPLIFTAYSDDRRLCVVTHVLVRINNVLSVL